MELGKQSKRGRRAMTQLHICAAAPDASRQVKKQPRWWLNFASRVCLVLFLLLIFAAVIIPKHLETCECGTDMKANAMCRPHKIFGHSVCVSCATRRLFPGKR